MQFHLESIIEYDSKDGVTSPRTIVVGQLPEVQHGIRSVNSRSGCRVIGNIVQCSLRGRYKV